MEKILFINACIRPESRTLEMARYLLSFLEGEVEEVNLEMENIQPLNTETLRLRQELLANGSFDHPMLRYGNQFKQADTLVIAAPFYDFSFPAALKCYFEAIANVGLTFYYDEDENPQTLCRARRVYYVSACGSEFVPTFGFEYVKTMLDNFYHIHEAYCFSADRLDLKDSDPAYMIQQAKEKIRKHFLDPVC